MSKDKPSAKDLKKSLFSQKKHASLLIKDSEIKKADKFCEDYKKFLNHAKTEREAVEFAVKQLEENGFVKFSKNMKLSAGSKVYYNNRGKAIIASIIGTDPIEEGTRICAAHIDSPRLDLKQCPVYEADEIALFKTHYYGGIKKYQWTTIPLSLHGVIVKQDGNSVKINIGED